MAAPCRVHTFRLNNSCPIDGILRKALGGSGCAELFRASYALAKAQTDDEREAATQRLHEAGRAYEAWAKEKSQENPEGATILDDVRTAHREAMRAHERGAYP